MMLITVEWDSLSSNLLEHTVGLIYSDVLKTALCPQCPQFFMVSFSLGLRSFGLVHHTYTPFSSQVWPYGTWLAWDAHTQTNS